MKNKCLAIIPARIGSKRLPGKNFINWFGRPIIEWIVDEVEKSQLFETIMISSDDIRETKKTIKNRDNIVWHQRSDKSSRYNVTVDQICLDVVKNYPRHDYICCIYPTAYAVKAQDLKLGLLNMDKFTLRGRETFPFCHSYGMLNYARHNLKYSSDNGGFYWAKVDAFLKQKTFMGKSFTIHELPMVDINTYDDYIDAMAHRLSMSDSLKKDCKCGK